MGSTPRRRASLPLPQGLRATTFSLGGDRLMVMSFPLTKVELPATLTAAEREVARAVLDGMTNAEIAAARGTSLRTVANQVASILLKTGTRSRGAFLAAVAGARPS